MTAASQRIDYATVTEVLGSRVSREAYDMMRTRYLWARGFCQGKDLLEVGCGPAQGLGLLARSAQRTVGGDPTSHLLEKASKHFGDRISFVCLDGQDLPFRSQSFDAVILFEAVYYLEDAKRFLRECARVLRRKGALLLCTANRERPDFNPSPYSFHYPSASELASWLQESGFEAEVFGAFPTTQKGSGRFIGWLRRIAVRLRLMPKTMKGKEFLKRLVYGPLVTIGPELSADGAAPKAPEPVDSTRPCSTYKVLYALGRLR